MRKGDNIHLRKDGRYEARYIKGRDEDNHVVYGYCYADTYEEAKRKKEEMVKDEKPVKQMNLLILGAGICGQEVKELAEQLRVFHTISFLEDFGDHQGVIGKISDLGRFMEEYPMAIPAIGDNDIRKKWFKALIDSGYIIPTLIHPSAIIGANVQLGTGTIICAGATIGQNVCMGRGCLISSGATVRRNVELQDWSYLDIGETISTNI